MTLIRIGTTLRQALDKAATNLRETAAGLLVPKHLIAGQHFGGFRGYEPWIQTCIQLALENARNIGSDDLSEMTALVSWCGVVDGKEQVEVRYFRHAEVVEKLDALCVQISQLNGRTDGLSSAAREQIAKAQGTRENGSLLVIAIDLTSPATRGELVLSISAWAASDVEAARAVPKRKYLLG